jgi:hypothetical protein
MAPPPPRRSSPRPFGGPLEVHPHTSFRRAHRCGVWGVAIHSDPSAARTATCIQAAPLQGVDVQIEEES